MKFHELLGIETTKLLPMERTTALKILKTIPQDCSEPHPKAVEGTIHDYRRANDKHQGDKILHYFQKSTLFFHKIPPCQIS